MAEQRDYLQSLNKVFFFLWIAAPFQLDGMLKKKPVVSIPKKVEHVDPAAEVLKKGLYSSCGDYGKQILSYELLSDSFSPSKFPSIANFFKSYHRRVFNLLKNMMSEGCFETLEMCLIVVPCGLDLQINSSLLLQIQMLDDSAGFEKSVEKVLDDEGIEALSQERVNNIVQKLRRVVLGQKERIVMLSSKETLKYPIVHKIFMGRLLESYVRLSNVFSSTTALSSTEEEQIVQVMQKWARLLIKNAISYLRDGAIHWKQDTERLFALNDPSKGLLYSQAAQANKKVPADHLCREIEISIKKMDPFIRSLRRSQRILDDVSGIKLDPKIVDFVLNHDPRFKAVSNFVTEILEAFQRDKRDNFYITALGFRHDFVLDFLKYEDLARSKGRLWEAVVALFFLRNGTKENDIGELVSVNQHVKKDMKEFSREFDVISSKLLCECKCVKWNSLPSEAFREIMFQLEEQAEIVQSYKGKKAFLLLSHFAVDENVKKAFDRIGVVCVAPNYKGSFAGLFDDPFYNKFAEIR